MSRLVDEDLEKISAIVKEETKALTNPEKIAPAGYIPITLSSEGNFGVPKKIYIRNFSTEDTLYLSMATNELLPEYLIPVLNKSIWNPDNEINVANWTEPQIVELLLKVYANYYSSTIQEVNFPINEEDITYLEENKKTAIIKQIEEGWKPKTDIFLGKLNFIDLTNKKLTEGIRLKNKNIDVVFGIPRFGDTMVLKKAIQEKFYLSDMKYEKISKLIETNPEKVSLAEVNEMEDYFLQKTIFITRLTKAYYIKSIDGKNVENLDLIEKVKLCDDPRLDSLIYKKYEKELKSIEYGVDPNVEVINPFTNKPCIRRFVFRPFNILQIIFLSDVDEYDVSYE